jgi:predicted dehydrogenase
MPMRVGVVGVGSLGFHHARILGELEAVESAGVHDIDAIRLDEVARTLGVTAHSELDSLLVGADAVVIAVPTAAHEEVALRALEHGCHVLIEKPIAPTLDAADRILEKARAAGLVVQVGHVERFNGAIRAAEPHLDRPLFVESHRLAPFGPRGTDVAVVLDLMIHDLDLVQSLVGEPAIAVAATGVPVLSPSPDIANARLEFEGGCVANLTASRVSMEKMRKVRFFQRSGYLSLDLAAGRGEFLRLRDGIRLEPGGHLQLGSLLDLVERVEIVGDGREPLRAELESFVAAVRGEAPVKVSGEDGRMALSVALEIMDRIERHVIATNSARAKG